MATTTLSARSVPVGSLPVIDIGGLRSKNRIERETVSNAVGAACRDKAFFYISGHGVPPRLIDRVIQEARNFFSQPSDAKRAVCRDLSFCDRGYEPFGYQTLEPGTAPDFKEAFDLGPELPETDPRVAARKLNHGPNLWPQGLPDFHRTMVAYFESMLSLSRLLIGGIGRSLGLADDYLAPFCHDPVALLRLLHYPEQAAGGTPGAIGAGAHTDFGAITILLQDGNGGLQLRGDDGGWIHAPPIPGTYVVNLGDLMARWTNDLYKSTEHRVVNTSGKDRYSVPFFLDGNPDYLVSCLPNCSGPGRPPKYEPITTADYVRATQRRIVTNGPGF